ncbi:ADP-ribosylglycohydrolase family protein [Thalassotalea aquiviva]|uniref:ADP-ribosylglycohydrolase family protein n=1 Tax=Thalassotalea aquiviva TaxID=3242415 RepID=UPI00352B1471
MMIRPLTLAIILATSVVSCSQQASLPSTFESPLTTELPANKIAISRAQYQDRLYGFWLGQSIANWTGLVTEMDKIGGEGIHGQFYTRDDWGKPDQPSIWGEGVPSNLSTTIDFVFADTDEVWGSDDDTDIEYIYQHLLHQHQTTILTGEQIRDGWLKHIYSEQESPLMLDGKRDNFLWVSNQRAHDLMAQQGLIPPATSDPTNNKEFDMIDAQLTTEIFGLLAPTRPDIALKMAKLPIQTTARENAQWASEFYVIMHSLAPTYQLSENKSDIILAMATTARQRLPEDSYSAKMFDYVLRRYQQGAKWEEVRDELYIKYQVNQEDGYDISSKNLYCNGCFASGINFAASIVSLLYGEGDLLETIKIAALAGWDSDNPAATWGGLLGFMYGKEGIEHAFKRTFSNRFNIHRTRGGFANNGIDTFENMALKGAEIIDRVVVEQMQGQYDEHNQRWLLPKVNVTIGKGQ